jgi:hypothetical protein
MVVCCIVLYFKLLTNFKMSIPTRTTINVLIPAPRLPMSSPTLSRVHRRRRIISESLQESQEGTEEGTDTERLVQTENNRDDVQRYDVANLISVNWMEFWKRVKIYPDQEVLYPDTSEYVSLRHRTREVSARARARANASDTESESDCEENNVVVV